MEASVRNHVLANSQGNENVGGIAEASDHKSPVSSPNANQKVAAKESSAVGFPNHVKAKDDGKVNKHKHKSDKHHHHHKDDAKHKHHKDDKKHRDDKMKNKHKESKEKHDKVKSSDKHSEHRHKDVHNSSSKPKEAHQSSASISEMKLKENHISHKESSKANHTGSNKITEDGKLKEKINNANSIIKLKVSTNSKSSSGGHESKIHKESKPKENNLPPKTTTTGDNNKKHHSDKHKSSERSHHDKPKDIHKVNSEDQKLKVEKKHKENREKLKDHGKEHKVHSSSDNVPQVSKVKVEMSSPTKSPMKSPVTSPTKVKEELVSDEDDVPLLQRQANQKAKAVKRQISDDDDEDVPLAARLPTIPKKVKKEPSKKRVLDDSDDDDVVRRKPKKTKVEEKTTASPKKKKKEEEEQNVWKWWEEEKYSDGKKWKTLEHKGPIFAPPYEPLPNSITFSYDGKVMKLSHDAEEVASFYAKMLDHDYTTKEAFNKNFFKDWRRSMNEKEKALITDLKKCNFNNMHQYFVQKSEERKSMTKEEKAELKKKNEELVKEYGFCIIDGHKEKIGNFRIEPPGLFRGRGEHPKMGTLKRRTLPEDIIINCGKSGKIPTPPAGHKWKEVRHDNSVTWLASWVENVQGQTKYIMLNASSKLKGEKDWQKYEVARKLKTKVDSIRQQYRLDWKSKEMRIRQRAVALYFIDKLALRAGNEKEEGETADTVGCCSLRVEHIKLREKDDTGREYVVEFDFLGKDSIRYQNSVCVEKRVFKNLQIFMENKHGEDDLFDRLNTSILNKHLNELMDGLTAKVFRTFNASKTLQEQLNLLTKPEYSVAEKILAYNRANRAVAILCNHQRSVPKTFGKSMEALQAKIKAKEDAVDELKREVKHLKKAKDRNYERKSKSLEKMIEQLKKLEVQATDKEENKDIALGTSKLNYLDPRISVAWCKKWEVPIEKIYSKTHREKFRWAIEMATSDFQF